MPQKNYEKKLQIYSLRNSFEIDWYLLTALVLWLLPFSFTFAKSIFPEYEEDLDLLLVYFAIIAFLYSLYFITSNFFKCEVMLFIPKAVTVLGCYK